MGAVIKSQLDRPSDRNTPHDQDGCRTASSIMRRLQESERQEGDEKGTLFGFFGYILDAYLLELVEFAACLVAPDSMHLVPSTT